MKLKAVKNFWMKEIKRGCMVCRSKDEEFEMDHSEPEQAEMIYSLLQGLKITIIDPNFVPDIGEYLCLVSFSYRDQADLPRMAIPGHQVTLTQSIAAEHLIAGHIRPIDEMGWTPRKLLSPTMKEGQVKKMFDDPIELEPWIKRGRK